jgi:hypothetical protein
MVDKDPSASLLPRYLAQLNRTRLSSDDIEEALAYLSKVDPAQDEVVQRGLLTAAIVAYGRPFTNNSTKPDTEATSQLSVNLKRLFTPNQLAQHEALISLRNEVVAHTEYARKPVKRLEGNQASFTMTGKVFDLLEQNIDMVLFQNMCQTLKGYCFQRLLELNQKIVEGENMRRENLDQG